MNDQAHDRHGTPPATDWTRPIDCGLALHFEGPQPRVFGAERARSDPMRTSGFVGAFEQGSPVRVAVLQVNPHCNGTHTETALHVHRDGPAVCDVTPRGPIAAVLATVPTASALSVPDEVGPAAEPEDRVVARGDLERALAAMGEPSVEALCLRTAGFGHPFRDYGREPSPYLTTAAAARLAQLGITHLVVEWPSIDRLEDGGLVTAHRAFWAIVGDRIGRPDATVTELAHFPGNAPDGRYALILHVPAFDGDAAPSRPVLFPYLQTVRSR